MKIKLFLYLVLVTVFSTGSLLSAETKADLQPKTVSDAYPNLTSGALSFAFLKDLPDNILLKADGIEITSESIAKIIGSQPEQARGELESNAFFVLEQEAANHLLLNLAGKTMSQSLKDISNQKDADIIQQFFEKQVFKNIEVTGEELKAFYENNKDICGGATLDQVGAALKEYLVAQKKQQMASEYIHALGKKVSIQVSQAWVKKHAALALDNPVDKARQSKKPSLVDFGATGCRPCDMMAPVLETLRKKHEGKLNVIFIHVRRQQILTSRYGIQSIPVQVFFDKNGKEVFRHIGFFPQDEIEKKLKEIGVQ